MTLFVPPQHERRGYRPRMTPFNTGRRFKGGGKGGSSDYADQARADEEERQARIREGTDRINQTFNGTLAGVNPAAAYDPTQTYYTASGEVYRPPSSDYREPTSTEKMFGVTRGDPGSGANPNDLLAKGQLFTGTQQQGGFDDNFYNARRQAYLDYANPQLQRQYEDAVKQLTFALGRNGLLDSTVRADREGKLQTEYDTQRQGIADKALDYENQARNQVEQARQNLISTLNVTGDASGAANSAITQAKNLQAPPAFDPLASLFEDATAGLATQAQLEARNASQYNTGLFPRRGTGSATVVR